MMQEPEFVQQARRTVQIAERLDAIKDATGWGMAAAWGRLRTGDVDGATELADDAERRMGA